MLFLVTAKSYLEETEAPHGAIDMAEQLKEYEAERNNTFEAWQKLKNRSSGDLYYSTAGEVESRDVSNRLDMTAEERKNTRPDIDRTDVVFADGGVSYSFNGDNISDNDSKQVINIIRNNINKISDKTVFNEKSVDIRNYDKKSDYVLDVFNKQGNVAINKAIGKIELVKSGAKSTMLHGYGKNKIAAIPAIKTIIENGDIISYTENYTDYYDRYVIAAKGIIDGKPAVVGVVINSYNNNGSNKFYLHEVEIIEAELSSMTGSQNSEDTVNNSASNNKIPQSDTAVNTKFTQEGGKYSISDENLSSEVSDKDTLGNTLTKAQQSYFANSKVRDENGNLKVMYHGTPNADFTVFKSGTYFTENKWYADVYQNQSASSLGYKKNANNPDTYAVYLDIEKPFDTRNKTERDIFYNEYYRQWGTGTDLMESGLPDWMDGQDLQEFLEENGYDYDGLILDEGGTGGYGDEVRSRGLGFPPLKFVVQFASLRSLFFLYQYPFIFPINFNIPTRFAADRSSLLIKVIDF